MPITEVASKEQVEEFLAKVVASIESGYFYYVNRPKNHQTGAELDVSQTAVVDFVQNLTYLNYYKGPRKSRQSIYGTIYEFGTAIDEIEVYIKLELVERFGTMMCNCISFHIPEQPIEYPFKRVE